MNEAAIGSNYDAPVVTAGTLLLTPEMSMETAFHYAIGECCAHVRGNVAAVVERHDVEGLHQLRVGLRRLNIATASFTPGADELRRRAKTFFDATGAARDFDVFLGELFEPVVAEMEPQEGFSILRARAAEARRRGWDTAAATISSPEFAALLDELAAAPWPNDQPNLSLGVHAPIALDKHLMRVAKRGRGFKTLDNEATHHLRIGLKKLRYAAEFYGSLFREKTVRRYLKPLKALQDLLGALNDAALVRGHLGRLIMEGEADVQSQAELSFAAGLITGWHLAAATRLRTEARERWRAFKQAPPFWAA